MSPPEFIISKICFSFAALILLSRIGYGLAFEISLSRIQLIILVFVAFGAIGSIWFISMNWVNNRQELSKAQEEWKSFIPTEHSQAPTAEEIAREVLKHIPQKPTYQRDRKSTQQEKKDEDVYLQASVKGTYGGSPFKIGDQIHITFTWTNLGNTHAINPIPLGRMYIRKDAAIETQQSVIKEFKKEFEARISDSKQEFSPLFPNKPRVLNLSGEILDKDLFNSLMNQEKRLFAVSAVRYQDKYGTQHESHFCQYLKNIFGNTMYWDDCQEYNTQIDIN